MSMYSKIGKNPLLTKSFCLFTDILGFSETISQNYNTGNSQKYLNGFYKVVSNASKSLTSPPLIWEYKIFTDNIVLGIPFKKLHSEDYFGLTIVPLIDYQLSMVLEDLFIRGGWSVGELYMDKLMVYGQSLIEAYKLESQKAINPRIIFTDEVKKLIRKHLSYYSPDVIPPQKYHVLKDIDGEYFVNYLAGLLDDEDDTPNFKLLQQHKDVVESRLSRHKNDLKIFSKYTWCAEYHNYFCKTFISKCPKKYFIPILTAGRNFSLIP